VAQKTDEYVSGPWWVWFEEREWIHPMTRSFGFNRSRASAAWFRRPRAFPASGLIDLFIYVFQSFMQSGTGRVDENGAHHNNNTFTRSGPSGVLAARGNGPYGRLAEGVQSRAPCE
jgi:hypothetical protein